MKSSILVFIIVSMASRLWAAEMVLSLPEVLRRGLAYSQEVKQASSQVKEAKESISEARSAIFPQIDGKVNATALQKPTTGVSTVSTSSGIFGSSEQYTAALTLAQPLYTGGLFSATLSRLKTEEEKARQNYFNVKQEQATRLISAFYAVAQAQEQLVSAQENQAILKAYLGVTSRYEKIGRVRSTDRMQASVNLGLSSSEIIQLTSALEQRKEELSILLGEKKPHSIRTEFEPTLPALQPLPLEQVMDAAIKNNPALKSAELEVERSEYLRDIDFASDHPRLDLTGEAGYQSPTRPEWLNDSSKYYSVGLTLKIPLFSGLSTLSKEKVYSERKYQVERVLEITRDGLQTRIQGLLLSLNSTLGQLKIVQDAAKQAREALTLANKGYQSGVVSSSDILNFQRSRYDTDKQLITAQFSYLQNLAALRKEMGIDLEKVYEK